MKAGANMFYFSVFIFDLSSEYKHENRKIQYVSDAPSWLFQR